MFHPHGFFGTELGDVDVIYHRGLFHLFYLRLPNHDLVGHAVSRDGITWEPRPVALRVGDPGAFDDDQIWTMGVARHGGLFHMLYTALGSAESGRVQRVGHAVSDDLETWRKSSDVNSWATAPYRAGREGAPWVAWRDPKPVVLEDGRVHVVVCARDPKAPALRQAAVAHLVSDDFEKWDVRPPLFVDRRNFELECPQLFSLAGRSYLTAAVMEDRSQRYWVASDDDGSEGRFVQPEDNRLAPRGHYAAKVCAFEGASLLFAFHDAGGAQPGDRFVPSPLSLCGEADGRITLARSPAWDARMSAARAVDLATLAPRFAARGAFGRDGSFESKEGTELFFAAAPASIALCLEVEVDAPLFGVALAVDQAGAGLFVEFERATSEVRVLVRELAEERGYPWFSQRVLSHGRYEPRPTLSMEVIRGEGELIVSVDGRVVVSTATVDVGQPGVGLLVTSGAIRVRELTVREIVSR